MIGISRCPHHFDNFVIVAAKWSRLLSICIYCRDLNLSLRRGDGVQVEKLADDGGTEGSFEGMQRLGWHALELRLTNDEDSSFIATVVWFQIHHSQFAAELPIVDYPARLQWSPLPAGESDVFSGNSVLPHVYKEESLESKSSVESRLVYAARRKQPLDVQSPLLETKSER